MGLDGAARRVTRTKTMGVTPDSPDRYRFHAQLVDAAYGGDIGGAEATIHDFEVDGVVAGPDLMVLELDVAANTHPYQYCPFVIPTTKNLVGRPLMAGWRSAVLKNLSGTSGCTHVNTLLLGLAELVTMVFFLRINEDVAYTTETRTDGSWTAGALEVSSGLDGICHGLRRGGAALRAADMKRAAASRGR